MVDLTPAQRPDWCPSVLVSTPILTEIPTWSVDHARPPMRYVNRVRRDPILRDFFLKLKAFADLS